MSALINAIRGHAAEFGVIAAKVPVKVAELLQQAQAQQVSVPALGSQQTPRWREQDSNHRSRVTRPSFLCRHMSLMLGFPHAEKSARTSTDTTRMPGASRRTDRRYGAGGEAWQLRRCM